MITTLCSKYEMILIIIIKISMAQINMKLTQFFPHAQTWTNVKKILMYAQCNHHHRVSILLAHTAVTVCLAGETETLAHVWTLTSVLKDLTAAQPTQVVWTHRVPTNASVTPATICPTIRAMVSGFPVSVLFLCLLFSFFNIPSLQTVFVPPW